MAYKIINENVYECVCEKCKYKWVAFSLPNACAKCKQRGWNRVKKNGN